MVITVVLTLYLLSGIYWHRMYMDLYVVLMDHDFELFQYLTYNRPPFDSSYYRHDRMFKFIFKESHKNGEIDRKRKKARNALVIMILSFIGAIPLTILLDTLFITLNIIE